MNTDTMRPARARKLYLPLFLERDTRAGQEATSFPMTREQLRRSVADMID